MQGWLFSRRKIHLIMLVTCKCNSLSSLLWKCFPRCLLSSWWRRGRDIRGWHWKESWWFQDRRWSGAEVNRLNVSHQLLGFLAKQYCVLCRQVWASELADTLSDREKSAVIFMYISKICNKCFDWSKQAHKKYSKKQDLFIFLLEKCTFLEEFMSIWIAKLTFLTCKWSVCHTALVRAIIVHKYRTLHNALSQILMELMQKRLACVWSVFNYIMWLFWCIRKAKWKIA